MPADRRTKIPAIPNVPTGLDVGMTRFLAALKEAVQVQVGQRGDTQDSAVTKRELASAVSTAVANAFANPNATPALVTAINTAVSEALSKALNTNSVLQLLDSSITEDQLDEDLATRIEALDEDGDQVGQIANDNAANLALLAGGTTNQVPSKNSATNYDVSWVDVELGLRTELWVDSGAMIPAVTNGAVVATVEATTNFENYDVCDFNASTEQYVYVKLSMPENWNLGTVKVKFYWTASTSSGSVVWGVSAVAESDGDAIDAAFGTAQTVTDTLIATGDVHVSAATGALTIGGTPATGDLIFFKIYRKAADASDTLAADARLFGVKIQATSTAPASAAW